MYRLHAGDQLKVPGEIIRRHLLLGVLLRRADDARMRQIKLRRHRRTCVRTDGNNNQRDYRLLGFHLDCAIHRGSGLSKMQWREMSRMHPPFNSAN